MCVCVCVCVSVCVCVCSCLLTHRMHQVPQLEKRCFETKIDESKKPTVSVKVNLLVGA